MTHPPSVWIRVVLLTFALSSTALIQATAGAAPSVAATDYEAYIAKAAEAAKASKAKFGVPRAVTVAQSILESGWGRSKLTTKYNNYFGIKCGATVSPYQNGCIALESDEYVKNKKKKYVSRFRTYSSMEKSFLDHGRLLNYADRYNAAFKYPNDPDKFIREVHKAGYATDPKYSTSVINLMKKWNLYRFDTAAPKPDLAISITLTQGDRSAKVRALQKLLANAGHKLTGTGYYGANTVAAVKAYQGSNGMPITGQADPAVLTRLAGVVDRGDSGPLVVAVHTLLAERGYPIDPDGAKFDKQTVATVKALQKKKRLPRTGIVSTKTWGALFG